MHEKASRDHASSSFPKLSPWPDKEVKSLRGHVFLYYRAVLPFLLHNLFAALSPCRKEMRINLGR